ncbi:MULTISPECIES: sigma-54-dependent Fis family transcriptional regulator [unclassified Bradyrhizobium]|uniref:sigma-54-dependent Fis family transcriptional regulator n=1 Tax=unclassified Bradyrhizobium TaxID=2631580 RepID=UPI001BA8370E|nr:MULTISPECIES: sigma-54-dependent Fis family transcriptional regulator [unclassified Bradyrhizobium]MBR1202938.1 sigma-54-dependent Fis family transcriptional regulator [Bradyrhizobium sp. AUGA SZCCT0124]MBR1314352.1 sigma-54-dependent Fis family transcriptional regulator [Bradyrhizobium sp. AUGA SZCCT0051]MBR1342630.1 sigma-54-dependent Fis family transcriptional regulator [Bradyrhizobium sp. AUGA SZCCT0105]MBR1352859.1 sigma-54-dependent Fis family transcriptional regulator [Bradyrhizobium 
MDQREVLAAWEKFVERGALSSDLRSSVAASWQRSRNHRVTVDRARAPLVADAELFRRRSKYAPLRHAARCALENSKTFLRDANSIMILTDPSGLIIDTQGDDRVIDAGRAVHLEHGGRWSEADIGTNAIGAALAESKPVQIHGTEHFCSEVQRWTCAAVPVHDPTDGELLGVVDISGPASTFNPQSLALAVAVGHHVESVLAQSVRQEHEELLCRFLGKRSQWANDECIVLDRRGMILHATERALNALQHDRHGIHNDAPTRFLKTVPFDEWPSRLKKLLPNASFNFVENERSGIGAIVVLHTRRRQLITHPDARKSRSESEGGETASSSSARKDSKPEPWSLQSMAASFVARDPAVRAIVRQVETAAARKMPILIRGETGTGKEQLARHAHIASGRTGAFVPVNCAALPESLIESELFGYAEGAFTGAQRGGSIGLVKEADGGTLFLDEIGDMPVALQAVLLRLLDDWTVRPVGGVRSKVDVFLVSATNARLDKAIVEGRFRSDLLYRLNTLEVTLPRLRDRTDFDAIVRHLLNTIDPNCEITPTDIAHLAARPWPGNVRELRNVLARFSLAAADGSINGASVENIVHPAGTESGSLHDIHRARILVVYAETAGNVSETARRLGVSRNTIYRALGQKKPE